MHCSTRVLVCGFLPVVLLHVLAAGCGGGDSAGSPVFVPPVEAGAEVQAEAAADVAADVSAEPPADALEVSAEALEAAKEGSTDVGPETAESGDAEEDTADAQEAATDAGEEDSCSGNLEVCNGLDDNCNGVKDEGDPGGGEACTVPNKQGECVYGTSHCTGGSIKCGQNQPSSDELCDGKDNDCDGVTDNGTVDTGAACNTPGLGICTPGTRQCVGGVIECVANASPTTETCNGLDDDCDGSVDDGFPGAGQPCIVAGQPANTPCEQGQTNCIGGQNGCSQTVFPVAEVCDGQDNDCNGLTDDPDEVNGVVCVTGLKGICGSGKTHCSGGAEQCIPDAQPGTVVETCNGLDDNCDGTVDNVVNVKLECATKLGNAQNVLDWSCTSGACAIAACGGLYKDCDGTADNGCEVNASTHVSHCGQCAHACSTDHAAPTCELGACKLSCDAGYGDCDGNADNGCELSLVSDVNNCGVCGKKCDANTGTPDCNNGACSIACNPGLADCDGVAGNGCEVALSTDPANCGMCGKACSTQGGTPSCNSALCSITCLAGFGNCDGTAANGCEASLSSDVLHCGTCATACSFAHASPVCVNSSCSLDTCSTGWGNCDGDDSTGCETALTSISHCGACFQLCQLAHATSSCASGACGISQCTNGWGNCDANPSNGCETNLQNSVASCGSCGAACNATNGTASCSVGACSIVCNSGYGNCDNNVATGCEASLASTGHCGACEVGCTNAHGSTACTAGKCVPTCDGGWASCDADPNNGCEADVQTDPQSCGSCGAVCSNAHGTTSCANGACVPVCSNGYGDCNGDPSDGCETSLSASALHCGQCGAACVNPNGSTSCISGLCTPSCTPGYASCDGNVQNGCETNLGSSAQHCGACQAACTNDHGSTACVNGACLPACSNGFGNCDSNLNNGCEADLSTSVSSCGACGVACTNGNGTTVCQGGACVPTCSSGWGSCDGNANNGCETQVSNNESNCGACGVVCTNPHGPTSCVAGACSPTCTGSWASCDGMASNGCETDVLTTLTDCGGCGVACVNPYGNTSCTNGACVPTCNSGAGNCDGDAVNGCETNLMTSVAHCGACGLPCANANGTTACSGGVCNPTCASGYASCDGNPRNGCETPTTTLTNCGACGVGCSLPHATVSCSTGTCQITACASGWGNCDGDAANGCEADLNSSASHCGGCGTACEQLNGTNNCVSGTCTPSCNPGYASCDGDPDNGCESNKSSDPDNCGGCGNVCSNAHGTTQCFNGACSPSCSSGYGNCDGNAANGCELQLNTNTNCAVCGGTCSLPSATASCASGSCQISSCNSGYANCDGMSANGCELNTQTSVTDCGGCGQECSSLNGTASCSLGACAITCNTNYGNCDGNARSNGCEAYLPTDVANCGTCGKACTGGLPCNGGLCQCAPTGLRAPFNTTSQDSTSGCYDASTVCTRDAYSFGSVGANFLYFNESITCSGTATCVSHVGITTYASAGYCDGSWDVYCDGVKMGTLNTLGMGCSGSAMTNGCSLTFSGPKTCSAIKMVAVAGSGYDGYCCYSGEYAPDSIITAISAW